MVIDPIFGGSYISEDASVLAEDGKIIVISFMNGARVHLNCLPLLRQRAQIIFSRLRTQSDEYKANLANSFISEIMPFLN